MVMMVLLQRNIIYFYKFCCDRIKGKYYLFLAWIYSSVASVAKERVILLNESV